MHDTLHLFATNEPKRKFDMDSLLRINSLVNPIALICPRYDRASGGGKASALHFKNDAQVPSILRICRGAKVELAGRNFLPVLGSLYTNSSMGEVLDIVYRPGENPGSADLPLCVLIQLYSYQGESFIKSFDKVVPIVPIVKSCPFRCCLRTYIPLRTCFAKTIHTYQGSSAGPVRPGQQPNSVQRVVIDISTRQFEGNNPGLSYTALGRAAMLGDPSNPTMSTALYFDGHTMTPTRVMNITKRANGQLYRKVQLRHLWVQHLRANTLDLSYGTSARGRLFRWISSFAPTQDQISTFHSIFFGSNS
jgi:hypothetical protein